MGPGERRLKQLVVTGDDFGLSPAVNEAIEIAHRDGILTAASIMIGAPHAADAVARARRMPALAVGLHVVLTRGHAVLPPSEIPALVGADGCFDSNLVRAGVRYFARPDVRRQVEREIAAQFEAFRRTGLTLDHVNAHNHMHVHPTIFATLVRIARAFDAPAVRVPYEPGTGGAALVWKLWTARMKHRLRRAGLRYNDLLFGLADTGRLDRDRLQRLVQRIPDGLTEIMCHPATGPWQGMDPAARGFRFRDELTALVDGSVREALARHGVVLTSFHAAR